ncbi:P-loop containing nucleoside triphosphate hydrolase protein [Durotheca rogersii]|uniref:P-loop containing nucleoside triphosphate hydrolase protein n=1 Tax=Durotheca rogersii TaxID=419775 RepID=UPI00221FAB19|nr:P-loop containing nucleoside triphosphate hydrolase protein [Durotheca rogersii]KAI5863739.1 P-loop containing nucleoside triphosphate hydrolase protein [Durotheca rogersii]
METLKSRPSGCRFGASCKFSHSTLLPTAPHNVEGQAGDTQASTRGQRNNDDFHHWRRLLSRASAGGNPNIPQVFQTAQSLIQGDMDTLQKAVAELATDKGGSVIRKMIDEHIPSCGSDQGRFILWRTCVKPFFLILTDPRVVRSAILEMHLGTIYNVVFGFNASRLTTLFGFLGDLATKWEGRRIDPDDESMGEFLEKCAAVLAKLVDCNTSALVNDDIPPVVAQLRQRVDNLTMSHLEHIYRRLGVVQGLRQQPNFVLGRDFPGALSIAGPRHDNDSDDITKIQILPTMSEIMSVRADYRPLSDPSTLHLPGIRGLIDRHFRLLREDMVGQLKEAICEQLSVSEHPETKNNVERPNSARTNAYTVVGIVDIRHTFQAGLDIHLKIEQPSPTRGLSARLRKEWWNWSKRLEIGALVCLLEKGTAIFCVVSQSTVRPNSNRRNNNENEDEVADLFSHQDFAYVNLNLAEPNETDLTAIALAFHSQPTGRTLLEFPGILLPSFKPTLSALQQIYTSLELPFVDLLAPSSTSPGPTNVPLPLYATKPGFVFDLTSLDTSNNGRFLFSPQNKPNPLELCRRSSLDEGQARALLNALTRSLALIQGPPGTGKSYTGEAIIKVLLGSASRTTLGPILCVCYTNHALDQLLENLWKGGVKQIIRIGAGSKSEILQDLNLREVRKTSERTKAEKQHVWRYHNELDSVEEEVEDYLLKLKTATTTSRLKEYLKEHETQFHDTIFGEEDSDWQVAGSNNAQRRLHKWIFGGHRSERPVRHRAALRACNPLTLNRAERILLVDIWKREMIGDVIEELISLQGDYQEAKKNHEIALREVDLRVLQEAQVIGVTTSGLAKNRDCLQKLGVKVLLCEEAGEVLESHILTALLPSVEHTILIGDHLQLRPQVSNYELSAANPNGPQYSLDVSLFERLVQPARSSDRRIPFDILNVQRRMHPSISRLIRDTLYPSLKDVAKVGDYPEVVGMKRRLFWFDHAKPEEQQNHRDAVSKSRTNDFEVGMTCALVSHLVRQGTYASEDIAIITPYLGQLQKLRKRLKESFEVAVNDRDLDDLQKEGLESTTEVRKQNLEHCVRIATVDNFQGEEAKVIVISLVRSNQARQCGFLRTTNRINVLLSRAKHGMYILGNSATYGTVDMWSQVIDILKENGNHGTKLQLQCPRHKDTPIEVRELEDFARLSPEGGCGLPCFRRLDCGHTCPSKCHSEPLHKAVKCLKPCQRQQKGCHHACPKLCGEKCGEKCLTVLKGQTLVLPCQHVLKSPKCWQKQKPDQVLCSETTEKVVPGCNHRVQVACHKDVTKNKFICPATCGTPLPCGHACKYGCSSCRIREDGKVKEEAHRQCKSTCGRNYSSCRHACPLRCHQDEDCPQCEMPCEIQCCHSKCSKKCSEPCTPCAMPVCASACPHSQCTMPCAAPCDWIPCSRRCANVLPCGHQCPSLCGEPCVDVKYCQVCASDEIKGIVVDMLELREYRDIDLDLEPCIFPTCGHMMVVSSMDGQLGMSEHYETDEDGTILAVKASSAAPFSDTEVKSCPNCRGSLRNISRYGRIVRQALLDESTKKLISWSHSRSVAFEQRLIDEQERLKQAKKPERLVRSPVEGGNFEVGGTESNQLLAFHVWTGNSRYTSMFHLYNEMTAYLQNVRVEEQPYQRVHDLVQYARRAGETTGDFAVDPSKVQVRGQLLAEAMRFSCYLAVLGDFLRLWREAAEPGAALAIDVGEAAESCAGTIALARGANYARQEAEACLAYAQLVALVRQAGAGDVAAHAPRAERHLARAEVLVARHASAASLRGPLQAAQIAIRDGAFYVEVSAAERRAVYEAMAREFSGTGHWYRCARGHPFTVGECGLPMVQIRCPDCDAPIGGTNHTLAGGVQHDQEMDLLGAEAARLRIV